MAVLPDAAVVAGAGPVESGSAWAGLRPALARLDALLARAVEAADAAYGATAVGDPFRGLHIARADVERLLASEPGRPLLRASDDGLGHAAARSDDAGALSGTDFEADGLLERLGRAYDLRAFDLDLILIALAPEIDLRYERLYAYLQDDVTRRRPTVSLALDLLCASADEKIARRAHLGPSAPLLRNGVLSLVAEHHPASPPLLAHSLKLDDQIVNLLLGQTDLDPALAAFCRVIEQPGSPDELPLSPETRRALTGLGQQARQHEQPLRCYFHGPRGAGVRLAAEGLAQALGLPLLVCDLASAARAGALAQLSRVLREAWLRDAVLLLDGIDGLIEAEPIDGWPALLDALDRDRGITVLAGTGPWLPPTRAAGSDPLDIVVVPFATPTVAQRERWWRTCLERLGAELDLAEVGLLARRFRMTPGQIADAVSTAAARARWRAAAGLSWPAPGTGGAVDRFGLGGASDDLGLGHAGDDLARRDGSGNLTLADLLAAARGQSAHALDALADKIVPLATWDSLVVPDDTRAQLREVCERVDRREHVLGTWGFGRTLSHGRGVSTLFVGPSGTGKTMAAEIVAGELGLDLYRIDLALLVSKYIGETEKNLDRVFAAAEQANAILLFDEADALFGKRSEVRDSHDRYANLEISYLLQKMEQYDGLAILATNLRQNIDDAFVRRLAFTIHFPFPDAEHRHRIWQGIWPAELPLGQDVSLPALAERFALSGGSIKNVALAAAFLAAADGGVVQARHLAHAVRREYQKVGKQIAQAELDAIVPEVTA
jgi:hypothetical protein